MSEDRMKELSGKMEAITGLTKAPSQNTIFFHLLGTGKTMTVKEIATETGLTSKATERAVAKLLEKGLISRAPFRSRSYICDGKEIVLGLLVTVAELKERLEKRGL